MSTCCDSFLEQNGERPNTHLEVMSSPLNSAQQLMALLMTEDRPHTPAFIEALCVPL
jgi:hypothetical protein